MSSRPHSDERPVVRAPRSRRALWLALAASITLTVASCSSNGDGEEDGEAPQAPPVAQTPADVEGKVTDFAAYVGGSGPADGSLEPVRIGYVNQQGGEIEVTALNVEGVEIAAEYINTEAGGIGGRPVEIVTCFIANSEEEGQQ